MSNDKEFPDVKEEEHAADSATRARNRTVMLTPEITGQVRARLAQETGEHSEINGLISAGTPSASGFVIPHQGAILQRNQPNQQQGGSPQFSAQQTGTLTSQNTPNAQANMKTSPIVWAKPARVVGFLVSYDDDENGTVYDLRVGRLIVTSEIPGGGNYLFVDDSSVSPMHAIMRINQSGEIQILDQLSEFGTRIKRFGSEEEEELSGEKASLNHGDIIRFGNKLFHVCIVANGSSGG